MYITNTTIFDPDINPYFKHGEVNRWVLEDENGNLIGRIAEWVAAKPGYFFRHFTWKEEEKLTLDFAEAFNMAWASFKTQFEPLKPEYIREVLKKTKPVVDEEFMAL